MNVVLTIAGSDSSGGAGIQADIKTIAAHKCYAESVITALTAQNTTGVYGIMEVTPEFVTNQLECVFDDIPPDAVKIGMVSNVEIMKAIAEGLKKYGAKNVVVDPVMVATSGGKLMADGASDGLVKHLFPVATVITPNLPEAEVLGGMSVTTKEEMEAVAKKIYSECGTAVLIKGGHLEACSDDLLYDGRSTWFTTDRVATDNTHGTGCTLSSAIASNLAKGLELKEAVAAAKNYITGALKAGLDLGKGGGPLDHGWDR